MALNTYDTLLDSVKDTLFWAFLMFLMGMFVVSTVLKHQDNRKEAEYSVARIAATIEEAKEKALFIRELDTQPDTFLFRGQAVTIDEIWVEKLARNTHTLVWFPQEVTIGYRLCLNLKTGNAIFSDTEHPPYFLDMATGIKLNPRLDFRLFHLPLREEDITEISLMLLPSPMDKSQTKVAPTETEEPTSSESQPLPAEAADPETQPLSDPAPEQEPQQIGTPEQAIPKEPVKPEATPGAAHQEQAAIRLICSLPTFA